jgi:uncharacterized membrane protein YphA (DoxX/SURF4 family)
MPRTLGPRSLRSRALSPSWLLFWVIAVGALGVRLYLASLWFRFGITKVEAGWLTTNPVRGLLALVASGQTPMPIPSLSTVAGALIAARADVVLSVTLPLLELGLAAAFVSGYAVRGAAVVGIVVNASLILGGLASVGFDGRVILLQAVLLLAGTRAGALNIGTLARGLAPIRRAPGCLGTSAGQRLESRPT